MDKTKLELGDIIRIVSPNEVKLHNQVFFVYYLDPLDVIVLIHTTLLEKYEISLKDGGFLQSNVEKIEIINKSAEKGFARQNGLVRGSWVEIEFEGEQRIIITGLITELIEDMIEITTYPEKDILYIDFAYKGIPKEVPILNICSRTKPSFYDEDEEVEKKNDHLVDDYEKDTDVIFEYNAAGELQLDIPKQVNLEKDYREVLREEYNKSLSSSPTLTEENSGVVRRPHQIVYDVDVQMNELLDDFLFKLPEERRTRRAMKQVYIHINRFKELREKYSIFDIHHQITGFTRHDPQHYKPLVDSLYQMNCHVPWIIPVASVSRNLYGLVQDAPFQDCSLFSIDAKVQSEYDMIQSLFWENELPSTNYVKYENMIQRVSAEHWTPFTQIQETIHMPIATQLHVHHDCDMMLGHDNTLSSSVFKEEGVVQREKYVMQRFNKGIVKETREIMAPDSIHLHSMIILPESIVAQSSLNHSSSSILDKCSIVKPSSSTSSLFASHLLKHKEIQLESAANDGIFPLETAITHVTLEPREDTLYNGNIEHPTYLAFLQAMIPKSLDLVNKYHSRNDKKYCLTDYLHTFTPYMLTTESLSFGLYQRINKHIYQNILNYSNNYLRRRNDFGNYAVAKFKVRNDKQAILPPFRDTYLLGSRLIQKDFFTYFKVDENKSQDSEICHALSLMNDNRLFSYLILLSNSSLVSPQMMLEPFIEPKKFYDSSQKAISKKYSSIRSLQEDNDKRDLKYDTEYDANNYGVMLKYRKERSTRKPEDFLQFLAQTLAEDFGCSLENTTELAMDLIQGFKVVKEGDFALLEITPQLPTGVEECTFTDSEKDEIVIEAKVRKVQKYFKRMNNTWIYDPDVDASTFAKPNAMTCEMKGSKNYVAGNGFKNQQVFSNQYGLKMSEIEQKIKEKIEFEKKHLQMTTEMRKSKLMQFDRYHQKLGNKAYMSETIPSPHQAELDKINHKSIGFSEKQSFLIKFRILRCRDPLPQENPNWLYCKESDSSVPLMPKSQFLLAKAFEKGTYQQVLTQLIKSVGRISDGYYVDRYCGNVLDQIDYSEQGMELLKEVEEQDTWEPEDLNVLYQIDEHTDKKLYKNSKMRHVYNIVSAICKNLYIPVELIEGVTMSLCMEFMSDKNIFMGEEKYKKKMMERKKKEEKTKDIPYETFHQSILLDMVTTTLIVAIQTVVPSLVPRRTFGDCVKNLDGYPLSENSGSLGTIEYVSCILRKMQDDKNTMPWKTIHKKNGTMEQRLQRMFVQHVLKSERVQELLKDKRKYLAEHQEEIIPSYLHMEKSWPAFLPPIKQVSIINGLRNITNSVHTELKQFLKTGNSQQWKLIGMYFCKHLSFSFGTLEIINDIVRERGNLLGKYATANILENSCCHELTKPKIPIEYFNEVDPRIATYLTTVGKLGEALDRTVQFIRAPILHAETHVKKVMDKSKGSVYCNYSEYLRYRTFIKYCNLDSQIKPIPLFLERFLSIKPNHFNPKASIDEKIAFLKEEGKTINLSTFSSMMVQVNLENTIRSHTNIEISYQERILSLLDEWKDSAAEDAKLQSVHLLFKNYILREQLIPENNQVDLETANNNNNPPEKLKTDLLNKLENSLQIHIDQMKDELVSFMDELQVDKNAIRKTMLMFDQWDENLSYISTGHFIKNYIYYTCSILPNYISEGNEANKNIKVLSLIPEDEERLTNVLDEKYEYLKEFKKDASLSPLMNRAKKSLKSMFSFLSNFYGFFPADRNSLYKRFFQFCLLFIFHHLIEMSQKDDSIGNENENDNENEENDKSPLLEVADVKARLLKFIQTLLQTKNAYDKERKTTLFSYESIRKNVERLEAAEKKRMMDRFKNIKDIKTRRSELLLKKYHLGKFFVDPKVIKKYGKLRDKMIDTEDKTETDFLFGSDNVLIEEEDEDTSSVPFDPFHVNDGDLEEINKTDEEADEDFYDDEAQFIQQQEEDDDANDIAENAYDNM